MHASATRTYIKGRQRHQRKWGVGWRTEHRSKRQNGGEESKRKTDKKMEVEYRTRGRPGDRTTWTKEEDWRDKVPGRREANRTQAKETESTVQASILTLPLCQTFSHEAHTHTRPSLANGL